MAGMPTYQIPVQMEGPEGDIVTARTAVDFWNRYYAGYRPNSSPVPVVDSDNFNDAAVAALIDNMSSQTYAALARKVITADRLRLSQTPPTAPAPGTVWVDTSP
jgi:hypothetical protein